MLDNGGGSLQAGIVEVNTTNNRGFSVEYWADRCVEKIVHVAEDSDSVIKQQAMAFKDSIRHAIITHMERAIDSNKTTLYNLLLQQGEKEMAEILRRLN